MQSNAEEIAIESRPEEDFLSCTQRILTERFASIIEAMAQKSVEGSLPHTKYLFELGGVREELRQRIQNDGEPTFVDILVDVVKTHQEAVASAAAVKASGEAGVGSCGRPALPASDCGVKEQ